MKNIKLIVSDIDGVWTDGSFYYTKDGDSMRKFNTRDSYGIALANISKIPVLILSGEENPMVKKRMRKLGLKHIKLGVKNKFETLSNFCKYQKIKMNEVAFLGDDMNDFYLIGKVGFFACPSDAYPVIRENANKILLQAGGQGSFREFVEHILHEQGKLESAYKIYLS
jgi:YrbI family 3-deoxy-D-manno-octulosonate 8-phosphate phosphatase